MSELDLLPRNSGTEFARFNTLQWLTEATDSVLDNMPLTNSQREYLLQLVMERMREQTGASGAAVGLERSGQMVCRASSGDTAPDVGTPLRLEGSFTARCIQSGAPLRCDDSENDPRVNAEACRTLGIRSLLVVPIRAHDRIMGVVEVLSEQPRAFTNAHQTTLEAIAIVISEAFFPHISGPADCGSHDAAEHFQETHPVQPPTLARNFDDGTWGESEEIEEPAPTPMMFAGFHIRRPEIRKSAVVAFAAITCVASVGTIMLSRSPRRTVAPVNAASAQPDTPISAAQAPLQQAAAVSQRTDIAIRPAAAIPKKRVAAQWEDEVVTRPAQPQEAPPPAASSEPQPEAASASQQLTRAQIIGDPVYRVDPIYPQRAIDRHLEGTVVLSAVVDKEGRVQTVRVITGDPMFRAPAINAVKHWRYNPTIINGEAIEAETQVTLDFILSR
jgi:TonB family protein